MARNDARKFKPTIKNIGILTLERRQVSFEFSLLPDEAFGYFCGVILNTSHSAGGFQADSRAAIEALGLRVQAYFDSLPKNTRINEKKKSE